MPSRSPLLQLRQTRTETFETYQTFRGHRAQNTVVYRESDNSADPMPELSASVRNLSVTSGGGGATPRSSGGANAGTNHSGSISNLLKPSLSNTRSSSCSPSAAKRGLNGSTVSLGKTYPKQTIPSTTMPTTSIASFAAECVEAHNEYRRQHKLSDLKLSPSLSKYAQEWADTLSRRSVLQSRGGTRYGENIFCVQSSAPIELNGRDPVEQWYKEGRAHIFGKEPSTLKTGHFTQIVWRESEQIGVAIARNRNGQIFVVANYDPPGNVIGTYSENVPPVGGFAQDSLVGLTNGGAGGKAEERMRGGSKSLSFGGSSTATTAASPRQRDYVASKMPQNFSFSESVCDSDDSEAFGRGILKVHNEYRRKHNVPDLVLDTVLNAVAQSWAAELGKSDKFGHNPSTKYGENIYCLWTSDRTRNANPNPRDVVRSWYDEVRDFNFGYEPRGRVTTGHFTQLVWKASKRLGVGLAKTTTGKVVVVCNYDPSGNVAGHYNANVPRPV